MDKNYWYQDEIDDEEDDDDEEEGGAGKVIIILLSVLLIIAVLVVGGYFFLQKLDWEMETKFPGDSTRVIVEKTDDSIIIYDEPFVEAFEGKLVENNSNTTFDCQVTIGQGWKSSNRLNDSDLKSGEVAVTYTMLMYYEENNDTEIMKVFMAYNPEKDSMIPKGVYFKEGNSPAYETYDKAEIQSLFRDIY